MEDFSDCPVLKNAVLNLQKPLTHLQIRAKLSLIDTFLEFWYSSPYALKEEIKDNDKSSKTKLTPSEFAKKWGKLLGIAAEIIVRLQREVKGNEYHVCSFCFTNNSLTPFSTRLFLALVLFNRTLPRNSDVISFWIRFLSIRSMIELNSFPVFLTLFSYACFSWRILFFIFIYHYSSLVLVTDRSSLWR